MNQINLRGSFSFLTKVICFQKIYLFLIIIIIIISFSMTTLKDEWRRDTLLCARTHTCKHIMKKERTLRQEKPVSCTIEKNEEHRRKNERIFVDEDFFLSVSRPLALSRLPVQSERKDNVFFVFVLQTRLLLLFEPSDKRKT